MKSYISKRKAFTLIELLVVISIIALLLSILMPSLARVKEIARGVVCMSNIKQLSLLNNFYSSDNDDYLVPNVTYDDSLSYPWIIWRERLDSYIGNFERGEDTIGNCPSDSSARKVSGQENELDINFTYNDYLGSTFHEKEYVKRTSIKNISNVLQFADGKSRVETNGSGEKRLYVYYYISHYNYSVAGWTPFNPANPHTEDYSSLDFRHPKDDGVNVTYLDGHAERVNGDIPKASIAYPGNGSPRPYILKDPSRN